VPAVVPTDVHAAPSTDRSTAYDAAPVTVDQFSVTAVDDVDTTDSPAGAAGTVSAVAVGPYADAPPAFDARTR
jgi:hypothetical protein